MKMTSQYKVLTALLLLVSISIGACNKDVPDPVPNTPNDNKGSSIAELLNAPEYSFFKAAVARAGMTAALSNKKSVYTVFAPKNDAFIASGIPSEAVIGALPVPTVTALVQYHIIPGINMHEEGIPETYPNFQAPTAFIIPAPNTNPLVRFSNFPSRRGTSVWVNNIPVTATDIEAANGVMHNVARLLSPPSRVLLDTMSRDPELVYLMAAVARADSGLPPGSKFSDYLANPVYSLTIFAPNNTAFMNLLTSLGLPADPSSIGFLPVATVQGILAYHVHILSGIPPVPPSTTPTVKFSRAFSVNFPATPTPIATFIATQLNPAPPLILAAGVGVKGLANSIFSNIVAADRHAINGVYHIIDQVLRPQ